VHSSGNRNGVILSAGKDLLFFILTLASAAAGKKQVLRCAQDDRVIDISF
jgi:hypothetical protein